MERLKREVRDAFERDNFEDFSERISSSRNMVQNMVGCDMRTIEKAAYNPVFYLLNTFIDYLWAYWQELQRLRGKMEKYAEKYELDDPLDPFDDAEFNKNEKTLLKAQQGA